ncbi:unnamed protein product [Toxocara canis]|uniref:Flavodoxin-like domain-containing protein n=1 Tax=Toxocara canis TaxID=6265 RepID=A0A183ULU4_TOXCA|nr:unnamed protein product [Toxocara canis]
MGLVGSVAGLAKAAKGQDARTIIEGGTSPARKVLRTLTNPIQDKKPNFASLSEAVSRIPSGSNIFVHTCAGTPTELLKEMCAQVDSGKLSDLHLSHILLVGDIPWNNEKFHGAFQAFSNFFCSHSILVCREILNGRHTVSSINFTITATNRLQSVMCDTWRTGTENSLVNDLEKCGGRECPGNVVEKAVETVLM